LSQRQADAAVNAPPEGKVLAALRRHPRRCCWHLAAVSGLEQTHHARCLEQTHHAR
jgi:hypothetical protein